MLTSESSLTQAANTADILPEVAFPPCCKRSLQYYLECAEGFLLKKTSLSKQAWKEFKESYGVPSFIDNCIKILSQWQKIPVVTREKIHQLPFPEYLPLSTAIHLLKIQGEKFLEFFASLQEIFQMQGYISAKDISSIAKMFHRQPKRYLVLEEEMTRDDWQLIAQKFKLTPEKLTIIQDKSEILAQGDTVFTDHVVQVLTLEGYDVSRILPKPKKQFTQLDLDSAVALYREENEALKKRIAELEGQKNQSEEVETQPTSESGPASTIPDSPVVNNSEADVSSSAACVEQIFTTQEERESVISQTTSEALSTPPQLSLDSLVGRKVIFTLNGQNKSGYLVGKGRIGLTVQIRSEQSIYSPKIDTIRIEHPDCSGEYYPLSDLLKTQQSTKSSRKLASFRDLLSQKA